MSSATFPLNVRIILSDPFPDLFSFDVACVCNHCRHMYQNCHSTMSLTSRLSCVYDDFTSYHVFSLMKSLMMIVLGLGHLVRALFHFPPKIG